MYNFLKSMFCIRLINRFSFRLITYVSFSYFFFYGDFPSPYMPHLLDWRFWKECTYPRGVSVSCRFIATSQKWIFSTFGKPCGWRLTEDYSWWICTIVLSNNMCPLPNFDSVLILSIINFSSTWHLILSWLDGLLLLAMVYFILKLISS